MTENHLEVCEQSKHDPDYLFVDDKYICRTSIGDIKMENCPYCGKNL